MIILSGSNISLVKDPRVLFIVIVIVAWILLARDDGGNDLIESLCFFFVPLILALSIATLTRRRRQWNCGNCGAIIKKAELNNSSFRVQSTSIYAKQITSASPQLGVGMLGGQGGSFVSMGSSTSHVPTVLGRIVASHRCSECKRTNQWLFDTEVQVWKDSATGQTSYDVIGRIRYP